MKKNQFNHPKNKGNKQTINKNWLFEKSPWYYDVNNWIVREEIWYPTFLYPTCLWLMPGCHSVFKLRQ